MKMPGYEPTAWMRDKVRERLNQAAPVLRNRRGPEPPSNEWAMVILTLTDPLEDATEEERDKWETSCDRCGKYCAIGEDFHTGAVTVIENGHRVSITFGMCGTCRLLESSL